MSTTTDHRLDHLANCPAPQEFDYRGARGDVIRGCHNCGRRVPHRVLKLREAEQSSTARYVLACVRCDSQILLNSPRPRIPLCIRCKERDLTRMTANREDHR